MPIRSRPDVRRLVALGAAVVTGVAVWVAVSGGPDEEGPMTGGVTAEDLTEVAHARVFFGHQSVGTNILDAVPGVYAAHGLRAPLIEQGPPEPGDAGGVIAHAFLGENGNPLLKLRDFDATLRSGVGGSVDVAMMKFCWADVGAGTDVDALFTAYRTTMADLQQDFPKVVFVHATVPLTTDQGLLSRLKGWLTGGGGSRQADNAARERLNALIRSEYADDHLFDLAAAESTAPDGARAAGTYAGQRYYALYDGYASDFGHLNGDGARVVAAAWLTAVAHAVAP